MEELGLQDWPRGINYKNAVPSRNTGLARPCRQTHPPASNTVIVTIMFIAILGILLLLSPTSSCRQHYIPSGSKVSPYNDGNNHPRLPPLSFQSDSTFQISIFEDLHFGESTLFSPTIYLSPLLLTKLFFSYRLVGSLGPPARHQLSQSNESDPRR